MVGTKFLEENILINNCKKNWEKSKCSKNQKVNNNFVNRVIKQKKIDILKKKIQLKKKSFKTRIILASYLWISTVKEQTSKSLMNQ